MKIKDSVNLSFLFRLYILKCKNIYNYLSLSQIAIKNNDDMII